MKKLKTFCAVAFIFGSILSVFAYCIDPEIPITAPIYVWTFLNGMGLIIIILETKL